MSPEAQRIAIAEACGWKFLEYETHPAITYEWGIDPKGKRSLLPDYLDDLNAMYEAEEMLLKSNQDLYDFDRVLNDFASPWPWHSKASVRAMAILHFLNLWEETSWTPQETWVGGEGGDV